MVFFVVLSIVAIGVGIGCYSAKRKFDDSIREFTQNSVSRIDS